MSIRMSMGICKRKKRKESVLYIIVKTDIYLRFFYKFSLFCYFNLKLMLLYSIHIKKLFSSYMNKNYFCRFSFYTYDGQIMV